MRKFLLCALAAASLFGAAPKKPKLVLALVFDQFRYDYLTRFRGEFTGGFDTLLTRGAVFSNARYVHFPTVTAVGHSTFLSGALPSLSGIVANDWYDQEERAHVTSVSDKSTKLLGGSGGEGASPRRLLVDTVGDELKMADGGKSHVIGISLKDRAAILPAGHMADAAYWFDIGSGVFVSSTYYLADLPAWVKEFNGAHPADRYRGLVWLDHKMPSSGADLYRMLEQSPYGNDLLERFAERVLEAEQLGRHEQTDVLAISFSAHDYVGHAYGPFAPEEREVTLQTDKFLQKLLEAANRQAGDGNVLVVMTGDHGAAPAPGRSAGWKIPGGHMPGSAVRDAVQAALAARYGAGDWVLGNWDLLIYLNRDLIARKKLDLAEVRRVAEQAASAVPHVSRVYTWDELHDGRVPGDATSRMIMNSFNARRSADLAFLPDPYWLFSGGATSHSTTYGYDTHVPVIFMGPGVRPGRYDGSITVNDIASTLATMLDVETPSGAAGRVLTEMLPR